MADSIGGQAASELGGLVKEVVKGATVDLAAGTIETVLGASGGSKGQSLGDDPAITDMAQQKQMAAKKRYNEVLAELEQFRQKKMVQVRQEEQKKVEEMQEVAFKKSEKTKKAEELTNLIAKQYGGAGGEVAKSHG